MYDGKSGAASLSISIVFFVSPFSERPSIAKFIQALTLFSLLMEDLTSPFLRAMGKAVASKVPAGKKKTTGGGALKKEAGGWERSTFSERDLKRLQRAGLVPDDKKRFKIPGSEVMPSPAAGWSVVFFAFFLRGFSLPAHEFLRGFLFIHGVQLYQLTPNAILHLAFFITL